MTEEYYITKSLITFGVYLFVSMMVMRELTNHNLKILTRKDVLTALAWPFIIVAIPFIGILYVLYVSVESIIMAYNALIYDDPQGKPTKTKIDEKSQIEIPTKTTQ